MQGLNFKLQMDYLWTRWKKDMRKFDISFRNELRKKVETIENDSGVELVVAIVPRRCATLSITWAWAWPSRFWY